MIPIYIRKIERSDSTNIQSSIINSQSGSGLSGLVFKASNAHEGLDDAASNSYDYLNNAGACTHDDCNDAASDANSDVEVADYDNYN